MVLENEQLKAKVRDLDHELALCKDQLRKVEEDRDIYRSAYTNAWKMMEDINRVCIFLI